MSARIRQVKAGTVKVGDTLDGYVVTGLGRVWSLDEEESCAWGAGPWERVRVQYAYGEKVAAPVDPKTARITAIREQLARNAVAMEYAGARNRREYADANERLAAELDTLEGRAPAAEAAPAAPAAPLYGSREWKQDRLNRLPALIRDYEYRALMGRRSARAHEQSRGRDAEASLVTLRAEMESLTAELAE